jgi:hypothetical protein
MIFAPAVAFVAAAFRSGRFSKPLQYLAAAIALPCQFSGWMLSLPASANDAVAQSIFGVGHMSLQVKELS